VLKIFKVASLAGVIFLAQSQVQAATCSCAGAPLANGINIGDFEDGRTSVTLSLVNSDISDLVEGSRTINDETGRSRDTESYLVKTTYGFNDHWAFTGIISYINHSRNIAISNTADEESSGVGDSLFLVSYAPQKIDPFTRDEWAVGVGLRAPTGENDNGEPIRFAEDLQPGQGAWGYSLWFHYAHAFNQQADLVYYIDGNYSSVNSNDREYSFEDEWTLTTGLSYSLNAEWSTNWSLNYRDASPHTRFSGEIPNTGGWWLDLSPSISYSLNPESTISLSGTIPLARDLEGTLQFTTKNSFALSYTHLF